MGNVKKKAYVGKREVDGRTILVYGEMTELPYLMTLTPVAVTPKGHKIREVFEPIIFLKGNDRTKTRYFNMGWAICHEDDEFDIETGIRIATRRFSPNPLETQNGKWLNDDMCEALVANEIKYIEEHLDNFINAFKYEEYSEEDYE